MIRLQNLTNRAIRFQGALIDAYGIADFSAINDYVTLARLTNSGKARYFTVSQENKPVAEEKPVAPVAEEIQVIEETPVIEEAPVAEVVEDKAEEEKPVEAPTPKRGKKRKNDSESD